MLQGGAHVRAARPGGAGAESAPEGYGGLVVQLAPSVRLEISMGLTHSGG